MLETKSVTRSPISLTTEFHQQMRRTLVSSSQHLDWNGILVEQSQNFSTLVEAELPAQSDHWFSFNMGTSSHLAQKHDDRLHDSVVRKGDSIFVPAGQPTYLRCQSANFCHQLLHIHLKPELVGQVAEASEIDAKRINFVNCFARQDLQLHQVAMLLLAELQSDSIMGRLYAESLTQVLVIHLLRHYSTSTPTITSEEQKLNSHPVATGDRLYPHFPGSRFVPSRTSKSLLTSAPLTLRVCSNRRWESPRISM